MPSPIDLAEYWLILMSVLAVGTAVVGAGIVAEQHEHEGDDEWLERQW